MSDTLKLVKIIDAADLPTPVIISSGNIYSKNARGSNCTGSNPTKILTLDNVATTFAEIIFINGIYQHLSEDYTISHNATNSVITWSRDIYSGDFIAVRAFK